MNRFAARPDLPQTQDIGLGEEFCEPKLRGEADCESSGRGEGAQAGHRAASRRARTAPAVSGGAGPLPAFPAWARPIASQSAEGRWDKGSGERRALECHGEGRRFAGQTAEGRTDSSRGIGGRLIRDAEEGRGAPGGPEPSADEGAFLAGAALAALDPLMRTAAASFRGCFNARLALRAAGASARILGRAEDEAALRDAFYLRSPGGDPGPAGRLLVAFRTVAGQRPDLIFRTEVAEKISAGLGLPSLFDGPESLERPDSGLTEVLHAAAALARSDRPAMFAAADAAALACQSLALGARWPGAIFALMLADAVLACRLAWPGFVPLLCTSKEAGKMALRAVRTHSPAGSGSVAGAQTESFGAAWRATFCLGIAEAAARAHDLYCGLARRAERLESALPKLRAKGAKGALEKILSEDAVTAAMRPGNLSDRAARRLFDRLAALGVLAELSGRPAFRLYGL